MTSRGRTAQRTRLIPAELGYLASLIRYAKRSQCKDRSATERRQSARLTRMVLVLGFLCLITLLKLAAISNAIRWLAGDAAEYRKEVVRQKPQTVLALEVKLGMYHAGFFPFGLKEYRLAGYMRALPRHSARGAAAWWALVLFQKVFFQFQGIAAVSAAGAHPRRACAPGRALGTAQRLRRHGRGPRRAAHDRHHPPHL